MHLIHRDAGSDGCIAQARLANRFFHASGTQLRNVSQQCSESLFSFGYVLSFTVSDGAHGVRRYAMQFGDLVDAGVRISQ
jgi:hypothetical protein